HRMIVRSTAEITDTDRHIKGNNGNWESKRIVLADDRVGFSFHETTIAAGTTNDFHYANHIEAVWLTRGKGTLRDLTNDKEYPLAAGSMYLLDGNEKHQVIVEEEMQMLCVFNPPVVGDENHDENGIYPLLRLQEDGSAVREKSGSRVGPRADPVTPPAAPRGVGGRRRLRGRLSVPSATAGEGSRGAFSRRARPGSWAGRARARGGTRCRRRG